ncbi:MAG: DUF6370 family protein [Verrucomicrobiia bacterium]
MKKTMLLLAASLLLALSTSSLLAVDTTGKEVTVTGSMVCGKCTLHETSSCQNVIQVTQDGKTVKYYLAKNDLSDAMHGDVCHGDSKNVTATGTVTEKDGKQILTVTKLEAAK